MSLLFLDGVNRIVVYGAVYIDEASSPNCRQVKVTGDIPDRPVLWTTKSDDSLKHTQPACSSTRARSQAKLRPWQGNAVMTKTIEAFNLKNSGPFPKVKWETVMAQTEHTMIREFKMKLSQRNVAF